MHDFEAETADQICAAESEVERLRERAAALEADVLRLRSEIALALACTEQAQHIAAKAEAELAAITAALDGQPLPPDAGERARRVGDVRSAATAAERARWERRIIGVEVDSTSGPPYGVAALRLSAEPAPEDDGLTAEDRAKGWRWETAYGSRWLYGPSARSPLAEVSFSKSGVGWYTNGDNGSGGSETGAAGQRAAVAHLRAAGVLPGGEG